MHARNLACRLSLPSILAVASLTIFAHRALLAGSPSCADGWLWATSGSFAVLLLTTLRRLKFDVWLMAIVVCATLLYLNYATYTDISERNYDGLSFFYYPNFLVEHGRLPPATSCQACVHPPLYAVLGAISIDVAKWTGLSSPQCALQGLSLLLSLTFVILGVQTIKCFSVNSVAQRFGALLLAFWPSCITQSIRAHDDVLLSCLCAGVLFCLVRWQKSDQFSHFAWAIALTSLAVFTKANAYAWVVLLLIVVMARAARDKLAWHRVGQASLAWLVLVVSVVSAAEMRAAKAGTQACHRIIGSICNISNEHFVGNAWVNYLGFDIRYFLTQPFLISDPYDPTRDYFVNMLLKSSLFSAMPLGPEFDDRLSAALAIVFSYLALGLLLYLLLGLPVAVVRGIGRHWILLLASLLMLGQLVALRIKVPLSLHADFRYVFPLLVPVAVCYSKLLEFWQSRLRVLFLGGCLLATAVAVSSIIFFRPNGAREKGHAEPTFENISGTLADFSGVRPPGTPVRDVGVLRFGPRQQLEFPLAQGTKLSGLDVSLDASNEYEILIRGRGMARRVYVGPSAGVTGLMRYRPNIGDPLADMHTVLIHPQYGNGYYALGHLRLIP